MSEELLQSLQNASLYQHPAGPFQVLQTHISWVLLTGEYAYKIKKPVDFGFLDFSTLEARRHFCREELRLNQRLAPQIYLEVVPLYGSPAAPQFSGDGEPFEYALKMRQFPQDCLLSELESAGGLAPEHVDALADQLARFHGAIPAADADSPHGTAAAVLEPVRQNFVQIRGMISDPEDLAQLDQLQGWAESVSERLNPLLDARRRRGHVRECHGDAHLGNIALLPEGPVLFDCIEFNEEFKWIDTISDLAFLAMDLEHRGHPGLAARLLSRYLEQTGDFEAVLLWDFYRAYRAVVRAKIALFQRNTPGLDAAGQDRLLETYRSYAALAERYTSIPQPYLLIMHGVSGTGKSTASGAIVEKLGAIRIRSDVERKRMHGLERQARSDSELDGGLYTPEASAALYRRLANLAETLLRAGHPVVIDAAFLKRAQRTLFHDVAQRLGVAHLIVHCNTEESFVREWIRRRAAAGTDVSEAGESVLDAQLASQEKLGEDEIMYTWEVAPLLPESIDALVIRLHHVLAQDRRGPVQP